MGPFWEFGPFSRVTLKQPIKEVMSSVACDRFLFISLTLHKAGAQGGNLVLLSRVSILTGIVCRSFCVDLFVLICPVCLYFFSGGKWREQRSTERSV